MMYIAGVVGTLYQRHLLHLSSIPTKYKDPVAEHFYSNGHDVADFAIMGIEKLNGTDQYRKTLEQLWKKQAKDVPII